jgi:hypothetical protein
MTIPSGEKRHDGNMAPAKSACVSLLRKGFIFAGCPFWRTQTVTPETWHLLGSLRSILLPQNLILEDGHSYGRNYPRRQHGSSLQVGCH